MYASADMRSRLVGIDMSSAERVQPRSQIALLRRFHNTANTMRPRQPPDAPKIINLVAEIRRKVMNSLPMKEDSSTCSDISSKVPVTCHGKCVTM
jgi:hypothetical protein